MNAFPRISVGAIVAGVISFLVLYVALALGLVFALSWLPESIDPHRVEQGFRVLGLLALLFPGYAAARVAGRRGLIHGLLTGACVVALGTLFLLYTFSWEGGDRQAVWIGIVRTAVAGMAFGGLGGLLGEWRNRRSRR